MRLTKDDQYDEFKRHFVAVARNYITDPSDKKQAALAKLAKNNFQNNMELTAWFNAMFIWRNTQFGIEVRWRIEPPSIPS